jgi:hypothetical protein
LQSRVRGRSLRSVRAKQPGLAVLHACGRVRE